MLKGTDKAYRRARGLRREMNLPEVLLWQQLRPRQIGSRWRKQHPVGPYNLDFYCDAAKLCVEVGGEAHDCGDRPERDFRRDDWLTQQCITTLRIPAADVLRDLEAVLIHIKEAVGRLTEPAPDGGGGTPEG